MQMTVKEKVLKSRRSCGLSSVCPFLGIICDSQVLLTLCVQYAEIKMDFAHFTKVQRNIHQCNKKYLKQQKPTHRG